MAQLVQIGDAHDTGQATPSKRHIQCKQIQIPCKLISSEMLLFDKSLSPDIKICTF